MSPTHTLNVEVIEYEPALEVPPQVTEWSTNRLGYFDLHLPSSHREHYVRIDMQPLEITDDRAIVTVTTNVYTIVRRRRWLAVGQCASLLAALALPWVAGEVYGPEAALGVATTLVAGLVIYVSWLAPPIRFWRG